MEICTILCDSMDGTGKYYAQRNKPAVKDKYRMISPISGTYKWNLIHKTNKQAT